MKKQTSAKFITIEGGEGVGKSTFIGGLCNALRGLEVNVLSTREPGGTLIADQIRSIFKCPPAGESLTSESEILLVAAARSQHIRHVIQPALARGEWVLCDRFSDSTRVYQGMLGGVQVQDVEWLVKFSTSGLEPSLTFLLDCDVQQSMKRIGKRQELEEGPNRYDLAEAHFHERVRQGYLRLAGFYPHRFFILKADESPEVVIQHAVSEIKRRFLQED